MSDERKCYAGDLSSDALGKTVRVTYKNGNIESTVTDVLREVRHHMVGGGRGIPSPPVAKTTMFFEGTRWTENAGLLVSREVGLTVDDTLEVTVLP